MDHFFAFDNDEIEYPIKILEWEIDSVKSNEPFSGIQTDWYFITYQTFEHFRVVLLQQVHMFVEL